jgi:hypothetical protein
MLSAAAKARITSAHVSAALVCPEGRLKVPRSLASTYENAGVADALMNALIKPKIRVIRSSTSKLGHTVPRI